ncbi:hypothetical protein CMI47_10255 [Candidatus Pacearchaeota archaeon]|nr:hypothetical protein [Candidatus Pacearchaeota archaeon]|tara:strand:- start:14471 stop:14755 length:285 start_codon:yes stop_codon:yes gene_type:complete
MPHPWKETANFDRIVKHCGKPRVVTYKKAWALHEAGQGQRLMTITPNDEGGRGTLWGTVGYHYVNRIEIVLFPKPFPQAVDMIFNIDVGQIEGM